MPTAIIEHQRKSKFLGYHLNWLIQSDIGLSKVLFLIETMVVAFIRIYDQTGYVEKRHTYNTQEKVTNHGYFGGSM